MANGTSTQSKLLEIHEGLDKVRKWTWLASVLLLFGVLLTGAMSFTVYRNADYVETLGVVSPQDVLAEVKKSHTQITDIHRVIIHREDPDFVHENPTPIEE